MRWGPAEPARRRWSLLNLIRVPPSPAPALPWVTDGEADRASAVGPAGATDLPPRSRTPSTGFDLYSG